MSDLFTTYEPRVGESNGKALRYLARGETRDQLRARIKAGEFPGLNVKLLRDCCDFHGRK